MAGFPHMYETLYGAGGGYYDVGDSAYAGGPEGPSHSSFVCWVAIFALAGVAILGGLKVAGFHFVVKV